MYSFAQEQTLSENANMQFVMNAMRNIQKHKRSRGTVPSERELMMSCHHEIRNLQLCTDIWWCTKDNIERKDWFDRVKGCDSVRGCSL